MEKASCVLPFVPVRAAADEDSEQVTQALFGDPLDVSERNNGWAAVTLADGYAGFVTADSVGEPLPKERAHVVVVPQAADRYSAPGCPRRGCAPSRWRQLAARRPVTRSPRLR